MASLAPEGPNAEQIKYWNETAGPKWIGLQRTIDAQIAPLGRAAMDAVRPAPGERVLDVGCGCGQTSLELARRVSPGGSVLGIDIATDMLAAARAEAESSGVENVTFENADAQTYGFAPASFDVAFSRFGVMFFIDSQAAFANIARAIRPGGRLAFVCWQALPLNPWMAVPMAAALAHVAFTPPASHDAPGPFAFADGERVHRILERAGFADVHGEAHHAQLTLGGGDLDGTTDFVLQLGPTGAVLREATQDVRDRVRIAVRSALEPYATPDGVRMDSATWIFTARRP
jgi:SAM-dependent methyltransferase